MNQRSFQRRVFLAALHATGLSIVGSWIAPVNAQECPPAVSYRLQSETVYEQVPVTRNRIEYEDVMVEKEIVTYRTVTA